MGLYVTLEEPTKPMRTEAAKSGVYHSDWDERDYPRIQILSLTDLLERDVKPDLPPAVGDPLLKAVQIKVAPGQTTIFDS